MSSSRGLELLGIAKRSPTRAEVESVFNYDT